MSRPKLTNAGRPATFEVEAYNERGEMVPTSIAGEHPLTLYLDKRELVTLMTLGQAPEALAIGYLRNQRLVGSIEDIAEVQVDWETDSVAIVTTKGKGVGAKTSRRAWKSAPSPPAAARAPCSAASWTKSIRSICART